MFGTRLDQKRGNAMEIQFIAPMKRESTRDYVYRFLKINIMNLALPPGTALSEQDIANRLKVSRTPVREAFIHLAKETLLDIIPQKGTYVSLINLNSVDEAIFFRETLDMAIIKLACESFADEQLVEMQANLVIQKQCVLERNYEKFFEINESFHRCIYIGCKKTNIWELSGHIHAHSNRARLLLNVAGRYNFDLVLSHHIDLLRAITEKNVEVGIEATHRHLNMIKIDTKTLLKEYAHYCENLE